jgi:thermolysin
VLSLPLVKHQSAVGEGLGVLGDRKKIAARASGGTFYAEDFLRPPVLNTIDIRLNPPRINNIANGQLAQSDIATDSDNNWGDPVAVDAHVYLGWTYDYLFKRIGFRGLNNGDAPMFGVINVYSAQQCVTTVPASQFGQFCTNAFWFGPPGGPGGRGMMVFGNGIPSNFFITSTGQTWGPLAGALDVVAHELGHGVTDYTSGLEYQGESGALNESFSDMIGTAVEAYFQARGSAAMQADYLIGEDAVKPLRPGSLSGIRSMQSPAVYGDPDHYSIRYTGTEDNGGVHINSGIPNNVYFLAIEGGANRVSGQSVTGVGFANREQIERVFFRAFTQMLPLRATFSQARAATIQSARDLYPSNAAVVNAVTAAWSAVGVQ